MEEELDSILQLIQSEHIERLLIDSYYVTECYLKELRKYVKIAYIDDLNMFTYPVDLLINYNIYAEKLDYRSQYQTAGIDTDFLLGCSYVPLRSEFRDAYRKKHDNVDCYLKSGMKNSKCTDHKKILITSGGTDSYNVIGNILTELKKQSWFDKVECHAILGRFHQYDSELQEQWKYDDNVFLHKNVTNMSEYMLMCDAAVTAAGTTVYELCACGLPSVIYTLADNQYNIAQELDKRGLIPWCGDIRENMNTCVDNIIDYLEKLLWNDNMLKKSSALLQNLIDGYGAERIAKKLL
jgi:spore coat polysaccharide biosynthesis predicted glycosyltransferase SpsG